MSRPTAPLPAPFAAAPFAVVEARRAGMSAGRLRSADLARPFVGIRAAEMPATIRELISAYLLKMAPSEFFSHRTAALIHEMWLPFEQADRLRLDVAVVPPARAPRDARVTGHHLVDRPGLVETADGLRVANAVETWCQLGTLLPVPDLVAAGDSLVRKDRPGEDLLPMLLAAADDHDRPCSKRLREAASLIRRGVRSAQETKVRLLLVGGGLPEPEINGEIESGAGVFVAECDLVYRHAKVLVEYEGDHHRSDPKQWRKDIVRYERLQDLGWRVIRVTADDLWLRPHETIARVRAALAGR
jgi:hypothetical protein